MNSKKRIAILISFMLLITMSFNIVPSHAAKSLKQLQKDIAQKQKELEESEKLEDDLTDQINDLEHDIYKLEAEISSGEVKLKGLKKDLKKAQDEVEDQNEALGGRLRNMYKNGNVGFVDVLFNSSSFSEFLTNLDLVQRIYASDKDVLEELQRKHDEIEKKKNEVEQLQEELKASKATAESEMSEIEAQKAKIAKDAKATARMLDQMEDEAAELSAQLQNSGQTSNSSNSKYSGGKFAWPVPASHTISSGYGWRTCPFHGHEWHAAIDIAAGMGSQVVSAASGRVVRTGWYGGFGNNVIVDHGGGVVTWYNHLSSIAVSSGQHVTRGQTVGYVGSTGSSTGPHLDYRVFKNGSDVNPMSYY